MTETTEHGFVPVSLQEFDLSSARVHPTQNPTRRVVTYDVRVSKHEGLGTFLIARCTRPEIANYVAQLVRDGRS